MKKISIILGLLISSWILKCQEFQFTIHFEDSKGNKDSIILGYDKLASNQIDTSYGEKNIIAKTKNSELDVRVSNVWNTITFNDSKNDKFQTKKQIVADSCGKWFPVISIDIFCKNWPLKATWNKKLFNNKCNEGSVFTSINPGGWWDTGSPSNLYRADLSEISQVSFTANYSNYFSSSYAYIDLNKDTISVYWIDFGDSSLLHLDVKPANSYDYEIYPNPTKGSIKVNGDINSIYCIYIVDLFGRLVLSTKKNVIDLNGIKSGIYIMSIHLKNGMTLNKKIINTR